MRRVVVLAWVLGGCAGGSDFSEPFDPEVPGGAEDSGSEGAADDGQPSTDDDDDDDDDDDADDDDDDDDDADDDDDDDDDDTGGDPIDPDVGPLPEFVDDCREAANDDVAAPAGLDVMGETEWSGLQLCAGDLDFYRVDVPPGTYVALEMTIAGGGSGSSDLDLWVVEHPEHPLSDPRVDLVPEVDFDDDVGGVNVIWDSSFTQPNELLAWENTTEHVVSHWFAVAGWEGATSDYDLEVTVDTLHDVRDCDDMFDDTSEDGPCNELMLVGQPPHGDEGWLVTHWTHYSSLRRELIYLVRWAARETASAFPDTNPIGLLDLSEDDGDTPGQMVGDLRHPSGTHIEGNDMDIAYYQTGPTNYGVEVCPHNGSFCTAAPDTLDAPRTAYFLTMLATTPELRVTGVDPEIYYAVEDAAWDLVDEGTLDAGEVGWMLDNLAFGSGWPYHHHHLHFSWNWEDAWSAAPLPPDGCWGAPHELTAAQMSKPEALRRGRLPRG